MNCFTVKFKSCFSCHGGSLFIVFKTCAVLFHVYRIQICIFINTFREVEIQTDVSTVRVKYFEYLMVRD